MKDGERHVVCAILVAMLLSTIPVIKAWPRWDERFAQIEQSTRDWYKAQELNPTTWERMGSPSWHGCCEKGDVYRTGFRVVEDGTKYGRDAYFYFKDGAWKEIPDDVIHWDQHAPDGRPTLFLLWGNGKELCFYPGREDK